uniref:G domain-containing protein n=1 Tax=Octactis speculum TaxID=3111310 RepID=A0A7S2HU96_9STRA
MDLRIKNALQEEKFSDSDDDALDDEYDGLGRAAQYSLTLEPDECAGCGIRLHSSSPNQPGFVPSHVLEKLLGVKASAEELEKDETDQIIENLLSGNDETYGEEPEKGNTGESSSPDWDPIDDDALLEDDEIPSRVICQRCHRLRNYGNVADDLRPGWSKSEALMPSHFEELIGALKGKRCVLVTMIDVFDFHGSVLPRLASLAGKNPLFVAVNKVDLLPSDYSPTRVRDWVVEECRYWASLEQIRPNNVHLVSAKTGSGIGKLMDAVRDLAKRRKCDIYVVGAANVGKSSFVNRLCNMEGGHADKRGSKKRKGGKKQMGVVPQKQGITTSALPGTTLSFLKIAVGEGVSLIDSPGIILRHQLTSRLSISELSSVVPSKNVEHVTLRLREGKAVCLGALARIELLEGKPFFFTFYVAQGVKLHSTSSEGIEAFVEKHVGGLLTPPHDPLRLEEVAPRLETFDLEVQGAGWTEAGSDIVLSGLGWVAVTGSGSCRVRVSVPEGVMVLQRPPLMPYEARASMGKSTGGRILKGPKKKKKPSTGKVGRYKRKG